MKKFLTILLAIISTATVFAQSDDDKDLIQVSGLVMTQDSLRGIPYTTVMIKDKGRGTISNYQGFFSLVTAKGDTVIFTAVGFQDAAFVVPDTLSGTKYSLIQLMSTDTVYLPESVIYPWPTKEEFKRAFLALDLPEDDLDRAKKNLEREHLRDMGLAMSMDGNESVDYYLRQEAKKFYYNGQIPPMNIFNPIAWSKFIKAWRDGDFKRKKNQ